MDDSILSSGFDDTLSFMDGKRFLLEGTDVVATRENASGKRMVPLEGILYGVTSVVAAGNGSIVVDKNLAPPGQTVNVQLKTVYPADLDWVNATSENGAVQLENTGTLKYSFVMPACDVVINASFSDVSSVMITSPEGIMSYMPLLPQTFEYDSGWYVVMKDMTMSERMVIREGARLFLQGGTTLTCEGGISVN